MHVLLGPLSGVEAKLLQDVYPIACAGSMAAASVLMIDLAPLKVKCQTCGAETQATPTRLLCGKCGDYRTQLVSGDEMLWCASSCYKTKAKAQKLSPMTCVCISSR